MKERIKQHFHDYYLLTGDVDALDFIQQIETMQISTIHSYAKKVIGQLGFEYGYGNELTISSSSAYLKARIVENVEGYIQDVKLRRGTAGVESLGIENVLLLSATPIQNREKEYLRLLTLLQPEQYMRMSPDRFSEILKKQKKIQKRVNVLISHMNQYQDYKARMTYGESGQGKNE